MKKILIIDDSQSIQKAISWRLKKKGYEIVALASDGNEGFEKFKSLSPDLTILDITMPNKDGRQCLKDIISLNPKAKVVMLSAVSAPEAIAECLSLGAIAFISKENLMQESYVENEVDRIFAEGK